MNGLNWKSVSETLPVRVIGLTLIGAALAAILMFSVLGWSMHAVDEVSVQREIKIVRRLSETFRNHIAHDQESATIWDDSVRYLIAPDSKKKEDWLDSNIGTWMHSHFGHDFTYVINADDQSVYASANGERVENIRFDDVREIVEPMADTLRQRMAKGDAVEGHLGLLSPGVSDFDYVDGRPTIISLKPVVSDTGQIVQAPGREFIHVAMQRLDNSLLNELADEYGFTDLRFSPVDISSVFDATIAFERSDGSILGYFIWRPARPGLIFLKAITPYLGIFYAVITGIMVLFAVLLRRRKEAHRMQEAKIHYMASHDALTGLLNRASFDEGVERLLAASVAKPVSVAIFYLDLDRFKQINDWYGHAAGDTVLCAVAARIASALPENALVSRIGGDEFNAAVPVETPISAELLCERMLDALSEPVVFNGQEVSVGTSIGVAMSSAGSTERIELVRRADVALYAAKSGGRGRFAVYDAQMEALDQSQLAVERELNAAISDLGQFRVLYQPKYITRTGELDSAEALVRWIHPTRGELLPDAFIRVAEEAGLVGQIGAHVLEQSCLDGLHWPLSRVSVNVSPVQWSDPNFSLSVAAILSRTGFDPNRLELEITETALIRDPESCNRNIRALRVLGVSIALDDFGAGYSSLGRLQSLEVDHVKIDRRFISGIGHSKSDESIVKATIEMAKAKGLSTTADGVQSEQQHVFLKDLGCDNLQGFLFSRPVAAEDIDALLRATRSQRRAGLANAS